MSKICKLCGDEKPLDEFYVRSGCKDPSIPRGRQSHCKPCHSRISNLRKYGLTPAEYDALHSEQGACCAACSAPEGDGPTRLQVDHCHETGRVRGLLCMQCNVTLGNVRDDINRLGLLVDYLMNTT